MTSLAPERSWLLNPGLLKLVHQCRRLIQSEFGVKLHLTEEHLEQQLADYARKTRSTHLIRTWETLKDQVPQLGAEDEEGINAGARRTYRGQIIPDDALPERDRSGESVEAPPRKTRVIYRGQVVG